MIKKCNCIHKFQDTKHGKGKRVHSVCDKGNFRCTVWGKIK